MRLYIKYANVKRGDERMDEMSTKRVRRAYFQGKIMNVHMKKRTFSAAGAKILLLHNSKVHVIRFLTLKF